MSREMVWRWNADQIVKKAVKQEVFKHLLRIEQAGEMIRRVKDCNRCGEIVVPDDKEMFRHQEDILDAAMAAKMLLEKL